MSMFMRDEAGAEDSVAQKLLLVARSIVVLVFGLLPLFFVPSNFVLVGYTKFFVASLAIFLALILFVFSLLRQGVVRTRFEMSIFVLWGVFAVSVLSALFSGDFFDSFWGTEVGVHSAIFTGILALVVTVWSQLCTDKTTVIRLYLLLAFSAVVLAVFHISRIFFGAGFLSFGGIFGSGLVASPFGDWNSLAIFFGLIVVLSLIALEQLPLRAAGRALFASLVGLSLIMLVVISFTAVFVVLALVSLVTLLYALTKGKFKMSEVTIPQSPAPAVSVFASLATLLISLFLVIGGSFIGGAVSKMTGVSYIEVRPSIQATAGIAKRVYSDHALLGIGPNRFIDAWKLYHDPAINATIFWNTSFQAGYGFIPTTFVTTGVLGGLLWSVFLLLLLYVGFRTFTKTAYADTTWYFISVSSYAASIYLWGMSVVYVPGSVLLLLAALCTGTFFASRQFMMPEKVREFTLLRNQQSVFLTVGATVMVVVISVGSLYFIGRHYMASYVFARGYADLLKGTDVAAATNEVSRAFDLARDDTFARKITTYGQGEVVKAMQVNPGTPNAQANFEKALASAVEAGRTATSLDGSDPDNWEALGRVYATVVPLNIENAYQLSHDAFEKARVLDPENPLRLVTLAELELLQKKNTDARDYINRAIALKANFTDAMYVLTQIEIADGNVEGAIAATQKTALLDSGNPVRFFQLGVLQFSAKHYQDAAQSLEHAISLSNDYSNARYFLAFAYDVLGKKADAINQLNAVLRLNPDSTEVKDLIAKLSRGESLLSPGAPPVGGQQPLKEGSENTKTKAPVTSGKAPDSSAITPVNVDTTQQPAKH